MFERFAPLAVERGEVRDVRGPALALGMDWQLRLPEDSAKQAEVKRRAIRMLADAADLACSVYDVAD